jgi:hypothetical protein
VSFTILVYIVKAWQQAERVEMGCGGSLGGVLMCRCMVIQGVVQPPPEHHAVQNRVLIASNYTIIYLDVHYLGLLS